MDQCAVLLNKQTRERSTSRSKVAILLFASSLLATACGQAPGTNSVSNDAVILSDIQKIVGGVDATGQEPFAKHIVGLYDAKIGAICTASILSESILVTAAHCVESEPEALRVVFGIDFGSEQLVVLPVDSYEASPVWAFRQMQSLNTGDIAVVKFAGGLPRGYEPVSFLTDTKQLTDGQSVLLAGYGASIVKQVMDPRTGAMVADHQESGKLRSVTTTIKKADYTVSEFTTDSSKGKSACHGDSGGPAYVEVGGKIVLAGVTSRSVDDEFDLCNVSAAYTSIPFYASWIVSTAKRLNSVPGKKVPVDLAGL